MPEIYENETKIDEILAISSEADIISYPRILGEPPREQYVDIGFRNVPRDLVRMRNSSGAALTVGDVCVFKNTANGDEITTTTTAGDKQLLRGGGYMAVESISDTSFGKFVRRGFTDKLKVDGTTDIAIGDRLTVFTAAGIAAKASAGQPYFAIALEAYTTNDSLGVIDAILLEPGTEDPANAGAQIAVIYTDITVTNTLTETSLISQSIPANTLSTGNAVRARLYIDDISFSGASPDLTFRLKYSTTTLVTLTYSSLTGAANKRGFIDVLLFATGATNSQEGTMTYHFVVAGDASGGLDAAFNAGVGTAAIDSTTAANLVVSVQWSEQSVSNTITFSNAIIEKISV